MAKKSSTSVNWKEVLGEARRRFGIKDFRPGQKDVLEAVFAGRDTLAIMPTGAGKSLTYQLPACFLPKPVVVVSPLIALMQDQQAKAESAEITAENLNSTLRKAEAMLAEHQIAEHIAQLIYCTPERLQTEAFQQQLLDAGGISLLVVDEAHTIVQWGHDFRPAFQAIGEARHRLGDPPVLALTATATEEVAEEILKSLHAVDAVRVSTGTERGNLFFSVHTTVSNAAKFARILEMLAQEKGTGIIYTASVKSADELFEFLTEHEVSVAHYHGKMKTKERCRVQEEFMRGEHKVMIATKAFGLGIDKADIRFVYHFEFPDSLETYAQEAGRAGRDGKPAHAVLLYRLEDKRIQTFFLAGRYPKPAELEAVYQALTGVVLTEVSTKTKASPEELEQSRADGAGPVGMEMEDEAEPGDMVEAEAREQSEPLVSSLAIAEAAGIGRRKTQVILNLLRESGLLREAERGYILSDAHVAGERLQGMLKTYVDRAARDRDHLAQMMHYAETPNCRTQVIRLYFGDPEGDPCLRCDNCARDHAEEMPARATELLGRGPAKVALREPETVAAHHEEVAVVETMQGSYQTTHQRPDALPEAAFVPGDEVRHEKFGAGKVVDVVNEMVLVDFMKGGEKKLRGDFLVLG